MSLLLYQQHSPYLPLLSDLPVQYHTNSKQYDQPTTRKKKSTSKRLSWATLLTVNFSGWRLTKALTSFSKESLQHLEIITKDQLIKLYSQLNPFPSIWLSHIPNLRKKKKYMLIFGWFIIYEIHGWIIRTKNNNNKKTSLKNSNSKAEWTITPKKS